MHGAERSSLLSSFPLSDSPLRLGGFFDTLYSRYDERFVVSAPIYQARLAGQNGIPPLRRFRFHVSITLRELMAKLAVASLAADDTH